MLQKLWYDRPVRTQLLIAVGAINLLAALVAGAVSIFNTKTATQVEMEASLEVAQRFVAARGWRRGLVSALPALDKYITNRYRQWLGHQKQKPPAVVACPSQNPFWAKSV